MKVRTAAMIEALENKEIEVQRIPGKYQLADIGTKTLTKTVLYSIMYQMNMINGKEAEEFVRRLEEGPKVRSIKVKDVEIEIGPTSLFFLIVVVIIVGIKELIQFICKKIRDAIVAKAKKTCGPPQWEEDVIEMINARTEILAQRMNRREVVKKRRKMGYCDRKSNDWNSRKFE